MFNVGRRDDFKLNIKVITAEQATAISSKRLSVNEIRKRIFDGIYAAAQEGKFSYKYLSGNALPGGIPLELASLGYQVIKAKYADNDGNYSYTIYWGPDAVAMVMV